MADDQHAETRIPLIEETMAVSKRAVETGHVRVRTIVEEHSQNVVADLTHEHIDVSRRVVERQVDIAPAPYEEAGAWIVPVIEERLVIEKRLFVIEEIVMSRSTTNEKVTVPTSVRTMRAIIERDDDHQDRRD